MFVARDVVDQESVAYEWDVETADAVYFLLHEWRLARVFISASDAFNFASTKNDGERLLLMHQHGSWHMMETSHKRVLLIRSVRLYRAGLSTFGANMF